MNTKFRGGVVRRLLDAGVAWHLRGWVSAAQGTSRRPLFLQVAMVLASPISGLSGSLSRRAHEGNSAPRSVTRCNS